MAVAVEGEREPLMMESRGDGWHELVTTLARAGSRYRYVLPDGVRVPDPASHFQPEDVNGPSEIIDHSAYRWRDSGWTGRPWETAVLYEIHVGAFTSSGTFAAVAERLPHLVELGVTAIELMPIGDFPGRHNWGYDGVLPYAPDSTYGRPDDLKALIDTAHSCGLMVLLDVVYNHFGPEGNYLARYAPNFFTARHHTPWGAAINFDGEHSTAVRAFFIENALYWLEEFHFDGLRLDAVHHLKDDSPTHILRELAATVRTRIADRSIHLILENEENQASLLERGTARPLRYTAQWNDDVHHVLHTAVTNEGHGYYADYVGDDQKLARALTEGFAFQGELMPYRGSPRGEPCTHLSPDCFVSFLQNHDQIGNRAFGERLSQLTSQEALRAVSAIHLLLPQIPLLFMGEEWAATEPFVFFCDFHGELAEAIREGRRREFAAFPAFLERHSGRPVPDPDAPGTFAAAKLNWDTLSQPPQRAWLKRYRSLLRIRHQELVPRLPLIRSQETRVQRLGRRALKAMWAVGPTETLCLIANLAPEAARCAEPVRGRILWREGPDSKGSELAPWSVVWAICSTPSDA
jgi:maltooligosyltrehalose trehalohydrolase